MRKILAALLFAAALVVGHSADADILFMGGEETSFVCAPSAQCITATSGSGFRSAYARGTYTVQGTGSTTTDPPTNRFTTPVFTPASSLWLRAEICAGAGGSGVSCAGNASGNNYSLLGFVDNTGVTAIVVRGTGTDNQLKISSRTSGGVFTDLVTCSNAFNFGLTQTDINVVFSMSGSITLYRDSIAICTYTGNTTNGDGGTTIDQIVLGGGINNVGAQTDYSEVIVATTDTRAMNLFTYYPNGSGNTVAWTGASPCTAILNNNPAVDATYISTPTSNLLEQCTVYNTLPAGSFNVLAFGMSMRGLNGATGPQNFDFVTRVGGTDYLSSDILLNNTNHTYGNYIQATNPNTGVAWTTGDLSAAGFNIGIKSRP